MHRCGGAVVRWCGGAVVHLILIWVSDGLWSEDAPALVCGLRLIDVAAPILAQEIPAWRASRTGR
ncbi:hypothetical protein Ae717Ps2_7244 [Pseudonocardia sp. Ae717_Ps2]|nr:hypothetical protein Ae717Ps2_7244 [Pseudonocardia sp. Ae717_Ps2]